MTCSGSDSTLSSSNWEDDSALLEELDDSIFRFARFLPTLPDTYYLAFVNVFFDSILVLFFT